MNSTVFSSSIHPWFDIYFSKINGILIRLRCETHIQTTKNMLMQITLIFFIICCAMVAAKDFYVCEAGNPKFLGTFVQSNEMSDGAPVFSNEHDMSIFRNKNFWYMGDLA